MATSGGTSLVILVNRGGRQLAAADVIATSGDPESIVAADLDDDGDLDLVVANGLVTPSGVIEQNTVSSTSTSWATPS